MSNGTTRLTSQHIVMESRSFIGSLWVNYSTWSMSYTRLVLCPQGKPWMVHSHECITIVTKDLELYIYIYIYMHTGVRILWGFSPWWLWVDKLRSFNGCPRWRNESWWIYSRWPKDNPNSTNVCWIILETFNCRTHGRLILTTHLGGPTLHKEFTRDNQRN